MSAYINRKTDQRQTVWKNSDIILRVQKDKNLIQAPHKQLDQFRAVGSGEVHCWQSTLLGKGGYLVSCTTECNQPKCVFHI